MSFGPAALAITNNATVKLTEIPNASAWISKASPEQLARIGQGSNGKFKIPVGPADNDPSNLYAEVKVGGNAVALLYNSGSVAMSNALAARTRDLPSMNSSIVGPQLAQMRAEEIAKAFGGTVEPAATAQTQALWRGRRPAQFTYDYVAMEQALQAIEARTAQSQGS
jgi:hypothetical protein